MFRIKITFALWFVCTIAIDSSSANYAWQSAEEGVIPADAVTGGYEASGTPLYVGRIMRNDTWLAAKIVPERNVAYYAEDEFERMATDFRWQYLIGKDFIWRRDRDGLIPPNAVNTRDKSDPVPNYIGRAFHEKDLVIGYIVPERNALLVPYNTKAYTYDKYEILVSPSCQCAKKL